MSPITARLDRVQIASWAPHGRRPPRLPGFRVIWDRFVRPQTSKGGYERCRHMVNPGTGTQVFWQYRRRAGWLKPWKITLIANDETGLCREEIEQVVRHCRWWRFLLIELALDFHPSSGIDQEYVKKHGIFGKSRHRRHHVYYGARKSPKLIRCYPKVNLDVFRVEAELHSGFLRANQISGIHSLANLGSVLLPKHFQFVRFDWKRLKQYLTRRFGRRGLRIWRRAKARSKSIHRAARYLRRRGVTNVHRFFLPLAINVEVRCSLSAWATKFERSSR